MAKVEQAEIQKKIDDEELFKLREEERKEMEN